MSAEDEDDVPSRGKKGKKDVIEDKSTPEPIDERFTRWAERCFEGEERATLFIVHQLLGRTLTKEGDLVCKRSVTHLWGDAGVKRQELVALTNEIIEEMQDEADQMRLPRRFVVAAYNSVKAGVFRRKTIEREPKRLLAKAFGRDADGEDEGDPMGGDLLRRRAETVLQDGRFYAEHVTTSLGGIITILSQQLKGKDDQINQLFASNMAYADAVNKLKDNEVERQMRLAEHELILTAKKKGISLIAGLLPDFLKKVTNGAVDLPGGRTPESMTIETVLDEKGGGLSVEEKQKIFGNWTDSGERLSPGILSESQVLILVGVLNEKVPVDDLDRLITEGSPDQLTVQQYTEVMGVLGGSIDKLMPLVKILQDRKATLDKRGGAPALPSQTRTQEP